MHKIALIGIGKISVDQHIPTLMASDEWELAATVSRSDVSHISELAGVAAYTDFDQMLAERPDITVVSLAMPPVPRFDYAAKAITAGRHVMLEKPPGATLSECKALADMARENSVTLYATWHSRHAEYVAAAKAWLGGKRLEKLTVTWREDVRYWHPGQDWVFEAGGLGVFDPGINALSIVTEILDQPIHLRRATLHFPENRHTPIAAQMQFHHAGGAQIEMELDWLATGAPLWNIEAVTDQGTLLLENGGGKLSINGAQEASVGGLVGEYPRLYAQMARLIEAGKSETDFAPLRHVADAFMLGQRVSAEAFEW